MGEKSELYEQLKEDLGGSFNTMALLNAPYVVRKSINLILRHRGSISYTDLWAELEKVEEDKRPSKEEMDDVLDVLCELGWLEKTKDGENIIYAVSTAQ